MDLAHATANLRQTAKQQKEFNNFKAMSALRKALLVQGMSPSLIARFIGKILFTISDEAISDPRFSDYVAALAENLIALHRELVSEFGDEIVFLDMAARIQIVV